MTLAVFLLPHVLDEPEVERQLRKQLSFPFEDIVSRLKSGDDHLQIFSPQELSQLSAILHEGLGVTEVASVKWSVPECGNAHVFRYKDRFFYVSGSDVIVSDDRFDSFGLPSDVFDLSFTGENRDGHLERLIICLVSKKNGERLKINGEGFLFLDGRLLSIPNLSCCQVCGQDESCKHIFAIIDDRSSAVIGGYLADKLSVLATILGSTFSNEDVQVDGGSGIREERNGKLISRLREVYKKKNSGGVPGILRNDGFFKLTRALVESIGKIIHQPEESSVQGFEVQPICFMSENVVDEFERLKLSLLKEAGQDITDNGANELGIIA